MVSNILIFNYCHSYRVLLITSNCLHHYFTANYDPITCFSLLPVFYQHATCVLCYFIIHSVTIIIYITVIYVAHNMCVWIIMHMILIITRIIFLSLTCCRYVENKPHYYHIYILYVCNYVAIGPLDPVAALVNLTGLALSNNQLNGQ